MSIVKMKKVRLLGMDSEKDIFLNKLLSMGCVEITQSSIDPADEVGKLLKPAGKNSYDEFAAKNAALQSALDLLNKYAPEKTGLFPVLTPVKSGKFFDEEYLESTLASAESINSFDKKLSEIYSEKSSLEARAMSLEPWIKLDIPLQTKKTKTTRVLFFTVSSLADIQEMESEIQTKSELAQVELVNQDKDQYYYWAVVFSSDFENVLDVLRKYGYSEVDFSGYEGTASENISKINGELNKLKAEVEKIKTELGTYSKYRKDIETCIDRTAQEMSRETVKGELLEAGTVFCLEGWVPVPSVDDLTKLLENSCCAYELSDPGADDDVPIKLKNSKLTEPLTLVTEMYSLPAYDNVDPNPLIMPFFTIFFGIMYADLGYGLILTVLGIIGSKMIKQKGAMKYMAGLLILCGITTSICGILFGSFFGDAIPVLSDMLGIEHIELWSLIDPLEEPMVMLIASIVIGIIHLLVGMAINAVLLIRDGHPLDALFDVGSWWLLFAGLALGALGKTWNVALAGAAALVLTQGRSKPTIIGKIIGGFASLYDITSYLGDVLSYTRLMALMLASSVIASVVNVLGSLTGSIVVFAIIFVIGHLFNMGINIIGTFVHAARLQFLEFFGKFYKDGGKPFRPFAYKTKYTDIVKEEK